jgi:hypothetical protein
MRKNGFFTAMSFLAMLILAAVAYSGTNIASNQDKSSRTQVKLRIEFEDNLITSGIAGASLKEVVQVLAAVTEAEFVLVGDRRWDKQAIFAQVDKEPLEKALARILRGYSYAVTPMAGSDMPKVTIVLKEIKGAPMTSSDVGDSHEQPQASVISADTEDSDVGDSHEQAQASVISADTENKAPGDNNASEADTAYEDLQAESDPNDSISNEFVPYDLDEFMPLPEQELVKEEPEQSPGGGALSAEEQAAWEERRRQAQLERSLSALYTEHSHLRAMAVEELTGIDDPRATRALESVARSDAASNDEQRRAAQALWHHAADLQFSDSIANQAIRQLADDGDPAVREIAKQALNDMERYQRRSQRP